MKQKSNSLSERLKPIVESKWFNYLSIIIIIFSAILVGATLGITPESEYYSLVNILETLILAFFSIEIILRIFAEEKPINYFRDPWNLFDFIIVILFFIPLKDKSIYVLRLIRVLRTFRLFRAFPNLRPVVKGIVNSITSVIFVALLLVIVMYIYSVIGVSTFSIIDPTHFGNIWRGLFTLFQILTLENWNTIMLPANSVYPLGGPLYFISFIVIGTMIIMNLFLGVIVGNMSKALDKLNETESMKEYLNEDATREKEISTRLKKIEKELKVLNKKRK
ncbi:MAG: ion transporter [archaeon]|jgi:voltage-gated sodium channel